MVDSTPYYIYNGGYDLLVLITIC